MYLYKSFKNKLNNFCKIKENYYNIVYVQAFLCMLFKKNLSNFVVYKILYSKLLEISYPNFGVLNLTEIKSV